MKKRTAVVTGSASGIGAATAALLAERGHRVIGVDRAEAEVVADLGTESGRTSMVEQVRALAPEGIEVIVANAGTLRADASSIRVNHFGAVATLEGLRPLLSADRPRAVLVASRATLLPTDDEVVEACLSGDEAEAVRRAEQAEAKLLYASSKKAVTLWLRRNAVLAQWAGAGIPLNAVAPGQVATAMIAHRTPAEHAARLRQLPMPLGGVATPEELAEVIAWLASPENSKLCGQVLFVDGGGEALFRDESIWAPVRLEHPVDA